MEMFLNECNGKIFRGEQQSNLHIAIGTYNPRKLPKKLSTYAKQPLLR
jgi:hypothetical protein